MIPLFLLAVLLYGQAFQLLMYIRRARIGGEDEAHWGRWVRDPEEAEGRVAEIIRYTQDDVTTSGQIRRRFDEVRLAILALVDRRTRFLASLVAAAPLMGLLGTVLGMLRTFYSIATGGGGETAGSVASGISEALVTTQTGLTIALPGLFMVMLIQRRRHDLEAKLSRLESLTLSTMRVE